MELTLVLSVGLDPELLINRNLALQSAGYTVIRAFSLNAAMDCFKTLDFDLVLLCQSIPPKDKDRLTSWIRASGSRIPVVSVSEKLYERDSFADATVYSDPEVLLLGVKEALVKAARPAAWMATSSHKIAAGVLAPKELAVAQGKKPPPSSTATINGRRQISIARSLHRAAS